MIGPDDLRPVDPYELYLSDGTRRARWLCPRCGADNASDLATGGSTPCVCRACWKAVTVAAPPDTPRVGIRATWVTVLPCGTQVEVKETPAGGHQYDAVSEGRSFGSYDSEWTKDMAYESALEAVNRHRERS